MNGYAPSPPPWPVTSDAGYVQDQNQDDNWASSGHDLASTLKVTQRAVAVDVDVDGRLDFVTCSVSGRFYEEIVSDFLG